MIFWNKFCGFAVIFFLSAHISFAQTGLSKASIVKFSEISLPKNNYPIGSNPLENNNLKNKSVIPQNYYTQHFGIMCKQELMLEKATKIPFRFRLGSLQQCNYLEGKR